MPFNSTIIFFSIFFFFSCSYSYFNLLVGFINLSLIFLFRFFDTFFFFHFLKSILYINIYIFVNFQILLKLFLFLMLDSAVAPVSNALIYFLFIP